MNICFFNSEKSWGGGEKWHYKMAECFHNAGDNAIVIVNTPSELGDRARSRGIPVFEFPSRKYSFINPIKISKLTHFFSDNQIDTVIMNNPFDLKMCAIAAKRANVRNIIYRRGMPHPIRDTALNRWLFGSVITNLIVISKEVERSIFANNSNIIDKNRVILMYNTIDAADYNVIAKPIGDKIIFGNTGRLVEQKGQHHLIEAAKRLKDKGYDFEVRIAGKGPLEAELKQLAHDLDVSDKVIFVGFVEKLELFLNDIDVFAFPSYFEGSAHSVVEAIYFGKPVIVFDVSTMPELVTDGETGYVVPFKDSTALATAMEQFILKPELIAKFQPAILERSRQSNQAEAYNRVRRLISSTES